MPPDFYETYVEGYIQGEGMLCFKNFYTADCMELMVGEVNGGQDSLLLPAEVTVSSPSLVTAITTSSSPTILLCQVMPLYPVPALHPAHHLEMTHKAKEKVMRTHSL